MQGVLTRADNGSTLSFFLEGESRGQAGESASDDHDIKFHILLLVKS